MKRFGFVLAVIAVLTVAGHGAIHHHDRNDSGACALCASPTSAAPSLVEFAAPAEAAVRGGLPRATVTVRLAASRSALPRSPPLA